MVESPELDVVKKYLSSDHEVLGEALDAFSERIENKYFGTLDPSDVEHLLSPVWGGVLSLAASISRTSHERHKLAEFMVNLAYRPTLTKDDRVCVVEGMTVWKDLPTFGWGVRDDWNFCTISVDITVHNAC